NERRNVPRVDGARIPSNTAGIAPCRRTARSSGAMAAAEVVQESGVEAAGEPPHAPVAQGRHAPLAEHDQQGVDQGRLAGQVQAVDQDARRADTPRGSTKQLPGDSAPRARNTRRSM
ncbi:hypothetical protein, partial [Streptomyces sp. NPDC048411]|uniref:hypothetical protein n=1 Tax=Streptomyces sp. NPDC048411 TaxID=3157206 RepID=UPI003455D07A